MLLEEEVEQMLVEVDEPLVELRGGVGLHFGGDAIDDAIDAPGEGGEVVRVAGNRNEVRNDVDGQEEIAQGADDLRPVLP